MSTAPSGLDPNRLRTLLRDAPLVTDVVVLESTTSTNDELRRRAEAGAPVGTVVLADRQTAGRGRRGHTWHSPFGLGLYLSVLLRPAERESEAPRWTLAAALAGCLACRESSGADVRIKWPNDLVVDGRKLGGVLADCRATGVGQLELVLGIGINVGHRREDLPPELAEQATSLRIAGSRPLLDRELLAAAVLRELGSIARTMARDWPAVSQRFAALAPAVRGARVQVLQGAERLEGRTDGIDVSGALRVVRSDGQVLLVRAADVVLPVGEGHAAGA